MPDYVQKMRTLNRHIQGFLHLEKKEWEIDYLIKSVTVQYASQFDSIATLLPGTRFEDLYIKLEALLLGLTTLDQDRQAVNSRQVNIKIAVDLLVKGLVISYHRTQQGACLRDKEFSGLEQIADWLSWESVVASYQTGHLSDIFSTATDVNAALLMVKRLFDVNPEYLALFDESVAAMKESEPGLFSS